MDPNLYNQILEETAELVRRAADPRRGTIALSPETAALLERLHVSAPVPAAVPATEPSAHPEPETAPAESVIAEPAPGSHRLELPGSLDRLAELVSGCEKCVLCRNRTQTVFADGNPEADLVFVGEAPGAEEDKRGLPFVGRAGQLLTDIIEKGMKLNRSDVYICNVIKCRPPENRDPSPEEKRACEPYLIQQLKIVKPKVICALGGHAAKTLLRTDESTGRLRGKWHSYEGIPLRVTYHPAYLLRDPSQKRKTWEDVQEIMKLLAGEVSP